MHGKVNDTLIRAPIMRVPHIETLIRAQQRKILMQTLNHVALAQTHNKKKNNNHGSAIG